MSSGDLFFPCCFFIWFVLFAFAPCPSVRRRCDGAFCAVGSRETVFKYNICLSFSSCFPPFLSIFYGLCVCVCVRVVRCACKRSRSIHVNCERAALFSLFHCLRTGGPLTAGPARPPHRQRSALASFRVAIDLFRWPRNAPFVHFPIKRISLRLLSLDRRGRPVVYSLSQSRPIKNYEMP